MTRTIGEEYWSDWWSDSHSTDSRERRLLWKVVGIEQVPEFGNCGKLVGAERIEAQKIEYRNAESLIE